MHYPKASVLNIMLQTIIVEELCGVPQTTICVLATQYFSFLLVYSFELQALVFVKKRWIRERWWCWLSSPIKAIQKNGFVFSILKFSYNLNMKSGSSFSCINNSDVGMMFPSKTFSFSMQKISGKLNRIIVLLSLFRADIWPCKPLLHIPSFSQTQNPPQRYDKFLTQSV